MKKDGRGLDVCNNWMHEIIIWERCKLNWKKNVLGLLGSIRDPLKDSGHEFQVKLVKMVLFFPLATFSSMGNCR